MINCPKSISIPYSHNMTKLQCYLIMACSKCFLNSMTAAEYMLICFHLNEYFKETLTYSKPFTNQGCMMQGKVNGVLICNTYLLEYFKIQILKRNIYWKLRLLFWKWKKKNKPRTEQRRPLNSAVLQRDLRQAFL